MIPPGSRPRRYASAMLIWKGCRRVTGIGALLKADVCLMNVEVHCVASRLALATGQAADTVSLFKNYQCTINASRHRQPVEELPVTANAIYKYLRPPGHLNFTRCKTSLQTTKQRTKSSAPVGSHFVAPSTHANKLRSAHSNAG